MNLQFSDTSRLRAGRPARNNVTHLVAIVVLLLTSCGLCQAPPTAIHSATASEIVHITVGRSVVLTSATSLRRVYVGNPAVLQTFTSGSNEVVLTAKIAGVSGLVLWDDEGGRRLYAISADVDPEPLRASLEQMFPGSVIHAETGEGKVVLTGSVPTEVAADAVLKMAALYSKDIVNSIRIVPVHAKQVQLKLRIVEVDRTRLDQMGINFFGNGRTAVATSTGQFGSTATGRGWRIQG